MSSIYHIVLDYLNKNPNYNNPISRKFDIVKIKENYFISDPNYSIPIEFSEENQVNKDLNLGGIVFF